jgi:uncharacterized cupredoxin-like copper-binding protein
MDEELLLPSLLFIALGIVGIWIALFSGIAETFEGLESVSAFIVVIGLILLPASLLRRGPPVRVKHIVPMVLVAALGIVLLGIPLMAATQVEEVEFSGREVTLVLSAAEWAFNKTNPVIKAQLGDLVRIKVTNEGEIIHDFAVPALAPEGTDLIPPGAEEELTFVAKRVGEFDYLCTVPGHADLGMKGKIIVESPEGGT